MLFFIHIKLVACVLACAHAITRIILKRLASGFSIELLKLSILGATLCLLYINDLPDDVICNVTSYADDTTLYSKYDQVFDLWQQLELASELESDLWDTVDWGRKWLVDFNYGKTQLVLFDWSNNTGAIDPSKWMGLFLRKNSVIKCWSWLSLLLGLLHYLYCDC